MTNHDANSMQQLPLFDLVIAAAWGSKNKFAATYFPLGLTWTVILNVIGSVIEWLESHDCDQHGFGSKPTDYFVVSVGKTLNSTLPCLVVSASSSKFPS